MSDDKRNNGSDSESDTKESTSQNASERKKAERDNIRAGFATLQNVLPQFKDRAQASRREILTTANDYIKSLRENVAAQNKDLNTLQGFTRVLDEQIAILKKDKTPENIAAAAELAEKIKLIVGTMDSYNVPESEDSSEDSSESKDSSEDSSESKDSSEDSSESESSSDPDSNINQRK